jgi:amino acid transporter
VSASALLVFASNTAIIGSYHVFLALSRMEFFPKIILRRNRLRGTPHYSIALATLIPIIVRYRQRKARKLAAQMNPKDAKRMRSIFSSRVRMTRPSRVLPATRLRMMTELCFCP